MELTDEVLSQLPKHAAPDGIIVAIECNEAAEGDIRISDLPSEPNASSEQISRRWTDHPKGILQHIA